MVIKQGRFDLPDERQTHHQGAAPAPVPSAETIRATTNPSLSHTAQPALKNLTIAIIVLVAGLMITVVTCLYMRSKENKLAEHKFISNCEEIKYKISNRLDDLARILLSGRALFDASNVVTREEWRIFNKQQRIDKQLPGIQGIGFALLIPRTELSQHILEIRNEGFPEYKVKPDGVRDIYSSIIYLEPFADRNLRAFGYDMFAEPVRRAAMERARDTDYPALSGKVVLVQETDNDIQAGTLMYVPVYRKGMPVDSIEQRRVAIRGWVYSPYRMNDLINGVLGRSHLESQRIHLEVFDGEQPLSHHLLYKNISAKSWHINPDNFIWQSSLDFNGHYWTLRLCLTNSGFFSGEYAKVWLMLILGTIISIFLSWFIFSLLDTRLNVQRLAEKLTKDLQDSTARQALAVDVGGVGIWDYDVNHNTLIWDDQMFRLYGITRAQFRGAYEAWTAGVHPEDRARGDEETKMALRGEKEFDTEFRVLWPDGSTHYIRAMASVQRNTASQGVRMVGTNWDITERKQTESYQEMGRAVLEILNEPGDFQHSIECVLDALKTRTGFDAVGIRLKNGDDFPYIAQEGFPDDFLLTEDSLIERNATGGACLDNEGNVCLKCTCGMVIAGKCDPASPCFTRGGSFWTNDSLQLQDIPPGEDPRYHPRNQCIHHGYSSVALIPVRYKNTIVGLIQLNDRRKGCFSRNTVEILEGIGAYIGAALGRSHAMKVLDKSEEYARALFDNNPIETIIVDRDGRVKMFNLAKKRSDGRLPVIGDIMYKDYAGKHEGDMRNELMECINSGKNKDFDELKYGDKFLSIRISSFSGGAIITAIDVTESKKLLANISQAKEEWERTFDALPDLIMLIDLDHRIIRANKAMAARIGTTTELMKGLHCHEIVHGVAAPLDCCPYSKLMSSGKIECAEVVEERMGGIFEITTTPLHDTAGKIVGCVHLARDLSAARRADRLASAGRIAASIAHEIRNPSTTISLALAQLCSTFQLEGAQTRYLEIITRNVNRINYLVTEMLNCANPPDLNMQLYDIHKIMDDVIESVELKMSAKELILVKEFTSDYSMVKVDKEQIGRVFLNLIINAIEAMPDRRGTLTITSENRGEFFLIIIKDTGKGIPPEDLKKIFDPFYTTKPSGIGLGLATSYSVVASHGGTIKVVSQISKGTIFTVILPV